MFATLVQTAIRGPQPPLQTPRGIVGLLAIEPTLCDAFMPKSTPFVFGFLVAQAGLVAIALADPQIL